MAQLGHDPYALRPFFFERVEHALHAAPVPWPRLCGHHRVVLDFGPDGFCVQIGLNGASQNQSFQQSSLSRSRHRARCSDGQTAEGRSAIVSRSSIIGPSRLLSLVSSPPEDSFSNDSVSVMSLRLRTAFPSEQSAHCCGKYYVLGEGRRSLEGHCILILGPLTDR